MSRDGKHERRKTPSCKTIIADQTLDIMMLKELAQGNL